MFVLVKLQPLTLKSKLTTFRTYVSAEVTPLLLSLEARLLTGSIGGRRIL